MRVSGRAPLVLCLVLCMALLFAASASAQPSDVQGHWAEKQVNEWVESGLVFGYEDGTFKPNNRITRAEFVALVNRAFEKQNPDAVAEYSDVAASNWFYAEVAAATAAGYVGGYDDGTFRPHSPISRQEAASVVARLLGLGGEAAEAAEAAFTDANAISAWAKVAVNAVAEGGIMGGYADGSFGPAKSITRAEAVVTLDRALEWVPVLAIVYDEAGTYGPAAGVRTINDMVTVKAAGVTLQNMIIRGDLIIAEEVGNGDVTLNNVAVEGVVYIRGGGADSIYINGGQYASVVVEKSAATGTVRIVAVDADGVAVVVAEAAKDNAVILDGEFESVTVKAAGVKVSANEGTKIGEFTVEKGLKDVKVDLAKDSSVAVMVADSDVTVTGKGEVGKTEGDGNVEKEDAAGPGGGGGGGDTTAPTIVSPEKVTIKGDGQTVTADFNKNTNEFTFTVNDGITYTKGTAELSGAPVDYALKLDKLPEGLETLLGSFFDTADFRKSGTVENRDGLMAEALRLLKEAAGNGKDGVKGSTLRLIGGITITLTDKANNSTTYTVKFV